MTFSKNVPKTSPAKMSAEALDMFIYNMMLEIGIPANLKGYRYLTDAVRIAYYDPQTASRIVDGLYERIAKDHDTTAQCVERTIRTALSRVDRLRDKAVLIKYFDSEQCPSPKKFINSVADRLRRMDLTDDDKIQSPHD